MSFVTRLYNIPTDKTQETLAEELATLEIPIKKLDLATNVKGECVGYCLVSFENQTDLDRFTSNFQKLRKDLVIYKNVMQL